MWQSEQQGQPAEQHYAEGRQDEGWRFPMSDSAKMIGHDRQGVSWAPGEEHELGEVTSFLSTLKG